VLGIKAVRDPDRGMGGVGGQLTEGFVRSFIRDVDAKICASLPCCSPINYE
jgi:hypothetical protein